MYDHIDDKVHERLYKEIQVPKKFYIQEKIKYKIQVHDQLIRI